MNILKSILRWSKRHFWKIIASICTVCLVIIASAIISAYISVQESARLSDNISYGYHKLFTPYIFNNKTGETILDNTPRYYLPLDKDSIAVYEKNGKKGLFNFISGEVVTEPRFDAAWVFNKGVGAVAVNDSVYFIDHKGEPLSDIKLPRVNGLTYIFNDDYFLAKTGGKWGVLDKTANWVIEPTHNFIERNREYWSVIDDDNYTLFDNNFNVVCSLERTSDVPDSLLSPIPYSPIDNSIFRHISNTYRDYYYRYYKNEK